MKVAQTSDAPSSRLKSRGKSVRALAVLSLATILTGCSSTSDLDVFGIFDEPTPATTTAGQAKLRAKADEQSEAAKAQPTPKLSSVPDRPVAPTSVDVRQNIVEGLVADRENARYSDQSIRLQGGSRKTFSTTPPAPEPEIASPPPAKVVKATAPPPASPPTPVEPVKETPPQPAPQIEWNSERQAARPPAVVSPPQTASVPPPPPVAAPTPAASGSGVEVDLAALDSGSGAAARSVGVTADEQVATIHFSDNSAKLDDLDRQILSEVASAQREMDALIIVIGHASSRTTNSDEVERNLANFRMSLARANQVATQLIAMGVDPDKVQVEAVADANPLYSETEITGEAGNRRADIYFRR